MSDVPQPDELEAEALNKGGTNDPPSSPRPPTPQAKGLKDAALEKLSQPLSGDTQAALRDIGRSAVALFEEDEDGDGVTDARGLRLLWTKNGKFSSTKLFASAASILVLLVSTFCVTFEGATIATQYVSFTVPSPNMEWALGIMAVFAANSHVDTRLKTPKV